MKRKATKSAQDLNGLGKQRCSVAGCSYTSVSGLRKGRGRCPYHWAEGVWGHAWASRRYPLHPEARVGA